MVVIAIIGVLASIVLVSLTGSRKEARVAKGLQFSQSIQHGLGAYAVGVWRFEDNVNDGSGYDNDGTINGDPQPVNSLSSLGRALDFDGDDDYVDCGNNESLDITGPITIEAWIKPVLAQEICGASPGNSGVVAKAKTGGWSWQLRYGHTGDCYLGFQFHEEGGGGIWVTVQQNLTAEEWYHVVGTFDGTNIKCYLNGTEKDTNQISGIESSDAELLIGDEGWGNNFTGTIDEVRIYEVALSIGQIQKHYAEGLERHNIVLK